MVPIRPFVSGDEALCLARFTEPVPNGKAPRYSPEEDRALAPNGGDRSAWTVRLAKGATWGTGTAT